MNQETSIKRIIIRAFFFFVISIIVPPLYASQREVLRTDTVNVVFDNPLRTAAEQIIKIYPEIKNEIEAAIGWKVAFRSTVVLVRNSTQFHKMVGSDLVVAYAVPEKNLIVIDYSKMNKYPFTLGITLKHELAHLLLYHHISRKVLPKWLDEGVCQWVSDGFSELIINRPRSYLQDATLAGNIMPFSALARSFPSEKKGLLLAYEQSKSVVAYIQRKYGNNGIINILNYLKAGATPDVAILNSLSISAEQLETEWQTSISPRYEWFIYLSNHLYWILFILASILTVWGFIRLGIKKRRYVDEDGA